VTGDRVPIDAQSVDAPLSRSAIFLVVTVHDGGAALAAARDLLGSVDDLVKNVGFRDLGGRLSCVVGIGSDLWDRLSPRAKPNDLRPFQAIRSARSAPGTPGDLLLHIRAERYDLCFELERMVLSTLGDAVTVEDEVTGFRYFDSRDLLGFVDGTANPAGADIPDAAIVGDEDPVFAGGSYVVVQRYLHDLDGWNRLSTEEQQRIIGRTKLDNVELDDVPTSHKELATIDDGAGGELDILRDNMPYGRPGSGEFGTYFIGYSARLWVIERMLLRMFVGVPHGTHDRILDFSTAVTGTTFFAPTREQLAELADGPLPAPQDGTSPSGAEPASDGSLGIGSLRTAPRPEGAPT
jgi:putative iron-dependent peroxidase